MRMPSIIPLWVCTAVNLPLSRGYEKSPACWMSPSGPPPSPPPFNTHDSSAPSASVHLTHTVPGADKSRRPFNTCCCSVHTSTSSVWCYTLTSSLNVNTLDVSTYASATAAAAVYYSRQHAVIRLTCAFLKKTGQLQRL